MKDLIDFDWFFYIAKVHLNYNRQEFFESTPRELSCLWEAHIKFNNWKFKENEEEKVYCVDELPFL